MSRAWASCPARKCFIRSDMPCGAALSKNEGCPSSDHSDWWIWLDDPALRWSYLAMKVTERPLDQAISFTACFTITWLSAVSKASEYL